MEIWGWAKPYAKHLEHSYSKHQPNLLDDLQGLLRRPSGTIESPHGIMNAQLPHIRDLACKCKETFGEHYPSVMNSLTVFCMYSYTMQDVDIDRLCGFGDVPGFPVGRESPADRNSHYTAYRELVGGARNPQMFQQANWATRACWEAFEKDTTLVSFSGSEAAQVFDKYLKWVCIDMRSPLLTVTTKLSTDLSTHLSTMFDEFWV